MRSHRKRGPRSGPSRVGPLLSRKGRSGLAAEVPLLDRLGSSNDFLSTIKTRGRNVPSVSLFRGSLLRAQAPTGYPAVQ